MPTGSCRQACWRGSGVGDRRRHPARSPGPLAEALIAAAAQHDLIITSGGVSTGEEDHVRTVMQAHGSLFFWRLAIKPGRPVALGPDRRHPVIGLPGNPVAALITFVTVARPLIEAMRARIPHVPRRFRVGSGFSYKKKPGSSRICQRLAGAGRGVLRRACGGFPRKGAGMLTSLTETDGLVELPERMSPISQPGMEVDFIPYSELI